MKNASYKELSYLVGMIMADGTFSGKVWRVTQNDKDYLDALQQIFGGKVEVNRKREGFKIVYQLRFNKEDSDWLSSNFPALNRDKNLLVVPQNVVFYSFLLGLWDGDGSIRLKSNKRLNCVSFLVRDALCKSLVQEFQKRSIYPRVYSVKLRGNMTIPMFELCFHTNKAYALLKEIYEASPLWLERKKVIFEKLEFFVPKENCQEKRKNHCSICNKKAVNPLCRSCLTKARISEVIRMREEGKSIATIAKLLDISSTSAWHLAHGSRAKVLNPILSQEVQAAEGIA